MRRWVFGVISLGGIHAAAENRIHTAPEGKLMQRLCDGAYQRFTYVDFIDHPRMPGTVWPGVTCCTACTEEWDRLNQLEQ
jgi:hypothetical protein